MLEDFCANVLKPLQLKITYFVLSCLQTSIDNVEKRSLILEAS